MADTDVTPEEEWRAIPGFSDYEASSLGRIRSIPRTKPVLNRWGTSPLRKLQGRILKPRIHTGGYLRVNTTGQIDLFVHRAIALAFHGLPPTPKHEAAHLNGNKKDNRSKNIVWATPLENAAHKFAHGTNSAGEKNGKSKLKDRDVPEIIRRYAFGETARSLSLEFGVAGSVIVRVASGSAYGHVVLEYREAAKLQAKQNIKDAKNANNSIRKNQRRDNGKEMFG